MLPPPRYSGSPSRISVGPRWWFAGIGLLATSDAAFAQGEDCECEVYWSTFVHNEGPSAISLAGDAGIMDDVNIQNTGTVQCPLKIVVTQESGDPWAISGAVTEFFSAVPGQVYSSGVTLQRIAAQAYRKEEAAEFKLTGYIQDGNGWHVRCGTGRQQTAFGHLEIHTTSLWESTTAKERVYSATNVGAQFIVNMEVNAVKMGKNVTTGRRWAQEAYPSGVSPLPLPHVLPDDSERYVGTYIEERLGIRDQCWDRLLQKRRDDTNSTWEAAVRELAELGMYRVQLTDPDIPVELVKRGTRNNTLIDTVTVPIAPIREYRWWHDHYDDGPNGAEEILPCDNPHACQGPPT